MRTIGILLVFAACNQDGSVHLNVAGDAAPDVEPPGGGVVVPWSARPSLPGALNERIYVSSATFQIAHLQIVGDAGPGDERTTRSAYQIAWAGAGPPEPETFPDAPVGVYSKATIQIGSPGVGVWAYTIDGTWLDDDDDVRGAGLKREELKPFRIFDYQRIDATIDCDNVLAAGGSAMVPIRLALLDVLAGINFDALFEDPNGVLLLGPGDPQLPALRMRLAQAFVSDRLP